MNWLKKLFKRKNKIPEFESFSKQSNKKAFAESDVYICGRKALNLKLVQNNKVIIEVNYVDLDTTTKIGTFNDKPLFYSPQVPDDQILGICKPKETGAGVCYGPILGEIYGRTY